MRLDLKVHVVHCFGKPSETDSIKFKISSKTTRGEKGQQ